jgi:two-component system, LytTR family, sensor kinase
MKQIPTKIFFWLSQFIFVGLVDFALGGITYFLLAIAGLLPIQVDTSGNQALRWVLATNLTETFITTITVNVYLSYTLPKKERKIQHYAALLLILYVLDAVLVPFIRDFGQDFDFWGQLFDTHPMSLIYRTHVIIAGFLLYQWLTRERIIMRKITEQEYQLLKLNELKTTAELEALQAKVNPHFLYNSLNSIAGLVHIDPDKAEKMVLLLAKFFRYSTNRYNEYYCNLTEELEIVETYLEVEKVRFGDKLNYQIKLADEELAKCLIPRFLIQPLVENALKHGISKIAEPGFILIDIQRLDNQVIIIVQDNGLPFGDNFEAGYGLQSTQDKLRLLGGKNAQMEIINQTPKQIKISLEMRKNVEKKLQTV